MEIKNILINHMTKPLGFDLSGLRIEFEIKTATNLKLEKKLELLVDQKIVYQTDWQVYDNNYFEPDLELQPRTKYTVLIKVRNVEQNLVAEQTSFFETGKMNEAFTGQWIGNSDKTIQNTLLKRDVKVSKPIKKARIYMTGLGVYELNINDKKVGNEFLAPGVTAYDKWIQVQTYDVTDAFKKGLNTLLISLGDGWYKGNFGFEGGKNNIYGDQQRAILELHLTYQDDTKELIISDGSWQTTAGSITKSAIYYGEDLDDTLKPNSWTKAIVLDEPTDLLEDRLSLPLTVQEYLPAKELIHTPAGEQVIDFKQNHAGWMEFYNREPKGTKLTFEVGEILQNGNFYNKNLREARASFTYISDGTNKWVRPHFTYFGYRYLKVSGNTVPIDLADFKSAVIYSDMPTTGAIKTNNSKVNRLFKNILWSQKSNFFDIPTDCPQRDERLGWTGDADIFSNTAALNMNVYEFFKKYAKDMSIEQKQHDGMLTMYAPAMGNNEGGAAIWGDAATIIPWNAYQTSNDPTILKQNYNSMKAWVEWIYQHTHDAKNNLWTGTFQFGDWLSLDGENPALPTGKTNEDFIASIYYYYSTWIVAETAKILGFTKDATHYQQLSREIKQAIFDEYITKNGRISIDTQTAYALTLYFKIVPDKLRAHVIDDLLARLKKDNNHLQTGFVGTPFLCQVLSANGQHALATKIFLNEDYPSWLYAVNLGATTTWERWNSVQSDGSMNPEGMNSLNHYSLGAIMEWAYKYVLGINHQDNGYQTVYLEPNFDYRLKHISGHYQSSYGDLKIKYDLEVNADHQIDLKIDVPYGQTVQLTLPNVTADGVSVDGTINNSEVICLEAGNHTLNYLPKENYIGKYNIDSPISLIAKDTDLFNQLEEISPVLHFFDDKENLQKFGNMSVQDVNAILPFINISDNDMKLINQTLTKTPLLSEKEVETV